jgi:DNA-binding transcriptional LysR family regulator
VDLKKLEHFSAVARQGGFARAADALHLTQPALTRSIQALEQEVGLRLLDRNRGGVTPTKAGRQLLRDAEDLLSRAKTARRNLALLASNAAGDIDLGIGPLPASMLLPGVLVRFARSFPGVKVHVHIDSAGELARKLRQDLIEVFLCARGALGDVQGFDQESLFRVPLALNVRRGHPLAGHRRLSADDLAAYPLISGSIEATSRTTSRTTSRFVDVFAPTITCDSYDAMRKLTLETDAIWLWPPAEPSREPTLVSLPVQHLGVPDQVEIVIVRHSGRSVSPGAVRMIELFRSAATEMAGRSP